MTPLENSKRSDSAKVNAQHYPRLSWRRVSNFHLEATFHQSRPRAEWAYRLMHSASYCQISSRADFRRLMKRLAINDLDAIDTWRRARNPHLFPDSLDLKESSLRSPMAAIDTDEVIRQKIIAGLIPARNP